MNETQKKVKRLLLEQIAEEVKEEDWEAAEEFIRIYNLYSSSQLTKVTTPGVINTPWTGPYKFGDFYCGPVSAIPSRDTANSVGSATSVKATA